jgi:3-phenylpropionate/trans-cinnamate dioxygenase ferredoxin subunit
VATVAEIPIGGRKIVEVEGRSIGVFNVHGSFYALRNLCPHQLAPLCAGKVLGTTLPSRPGEYIWGREGEIVRCPWHGWEFDITTGRSVFNPHSVRVRAYPVTVEPGGGDEGERPDPAEIDRVESFPVTVEGDLVVVHL